MRTPRLIAATVVLIVAVLTAATPTLADHGGPHCDELPANINPSHPDWDDSLDADNDGIGCDDDDKPMWQAPAATTTTVPTPAPPAQPVVGEPGVTG